VELRGEHVVLRPLRRQHVGRLVEIQSEPEVARWWGEPDAADFIAKAERRDEARALVVEADGRLVGMIQYYEHDDPEFRHAGIDLFLAPASHGRGLGTDAVRTLAGWLIRERGHHRLVIDPAADNTAAIRAYEKAGFKPVGIMREYWRDPGGVWRDGLLLDLLARELE
jgi:aminoglycoside 6'-N-acetyltransferase